MATEQLIYSTAIADGMPSLLSKFIVAQAKHETGNFSSRFFTVGNNAFGYSWVPGYDKWQLTDPGPVADNGNPIAQYATVQNSVHEITDWIKRRQRENEFPANLAEIATPEEYAWYLKNSGYYGGSFSTYADRLQYWFNNLPPLTIAAAAGGSLILIIALLWIVNKNL